jgi:hypothetical protein
MEIWIIFKTKNVYSLVFILLKINFMTDFLPKVKQTIGEHWNDK